jgi:hypothetical protein
MKPQTAIVQMGGWGSVGMLRRYHGKLTTSELKRYPTTLAKYGGKDLRFLDQFGQIEPRQFYQPRLVGDWAKLRRRRQGGPHNECGPHSISLR